MSRLDSWICFGCVILLFVAWCLVRMASITDDEMDWHESQKLINEEIEWREANRPMWRKRLDYLMWDAELESWEDAE